MKKTVKLYNIILPVIMLFALLTGSVMKMNADIAISWGLKHFNNETTPEVSAAGKKMLAENNGIYVGNTEEKKVFLTFDLGYEAGYTSGILDALKENNLKAIFFLTGNYLKEEELIGRMINEGHSIGNHTDKHKNLPDLSAEGAKTDIVSFQNQYYSLFKSPVKFFRPPSGRFNETTLKLASGEGLKTVMWSVAIVDFGKNALSETESTNLFMKRIHPGAIILMHIQQSYTPDVLRNLIKQIPEKGYTIGTPEELL